MPGITWLHLSDWHQHGKNFGRNVVRDALIADIQQRAKISSDLSHIDFIVFSGDVAHSGKAEEYTAAIEHLFAPVLKATRVTSDRLFIVPGNHDLDRGEFELLPPQLLSPFTSKNQVQDWLTNDRKRSRLLEPFEEYSKFVTSYTGQNHPAYTSVCTLQIAGKQVALLGLNSALMSGRYKDPQGRILDFGNLVVGEPQIHNALNHIADIDIRIAVLHHPFDWLAEFDRNRVEARLVRSCHFILRGHQHQAQVHDIRGTAGACVIVPAGASYDRRTPNDPCYTNSYNFAHLDLGAGQGTVDLRRWSDPRNEWVQDTDSSEGGRYSFTLPKQLGN